MSVNQRDLQAMVAAQGMPQRQMVHIPSEAEKAEVLKVQGMQVRTQAAALATQLLAQRQTSQQVWDKWVTHIEVYIREGLGAGPAHVRTGS